VKVSNRCQRAVWLLRVPVHLLDENVEQFDSVGVDSRVLTRKPTLWTVVVLEKLILNKFTSSVESKGSLS
jgi:hypothetical protein